MEKQYYAILSRDFNDDTIDTDIELSPEEIEQSTASIIFKSTNYSEVCEEYRNLKKSYPELKSLVEQETGEPANDSAEFCIVRISVMKDWETFE